MLMPSPSLFRKRGEGEEECAEEARCSGGSEVVV